MVERSGEGWAVMTAWDCFSRGVPAPGFMIYVASLPPGLVSEATFICTKVELAFFSVRDSDCILDFMGRIVFSTHLCCCNVFL